MCNSTKYILLLGCYYLWVFACAQGNFKIPDVYFEAFAPRGLRVSIPDQTGIKTFTFNGRINGALMTLETGDLNQYVTEPSAEFWIYDNPNVELHVGDYIEYWIFVQHDYLGYRKDALTWEVDELIDLNLKASKPSLDCRSTETTINEKRACKGKLIFHESFNTLDPNKWVVEEFIPTSGPNFEFNFYSADNVHIENSKLIVTPVAIRNKMDLRGTLDLKERCTRSNREECYYQQLGGFYLPPVKSGMIRSKTSFKYGKIEVLAKLPCGDWIYPEISLIPKNGLSSKTTKIYIAYSRGNAELSNSDGVEIGSKLLLSGRSLSPQEPERSDNLCSLMNGEPYCYKTHNYTILWRPDDVLSFIDGEPYEKIDIRRGGSWKDNEFYISLGVSVGGINDFPDDFTSGQHKKPWKNKDIRQLRNFFQARNHWLKTWTNTSSILIIEEIRIYAL